LSGRDFNKGARDADCGVGGKMSLEASSVDKGASEGMNGREREIRVIKDKHVHSGLG